MEEVEKIYWSIGEVAEKFRVAASAIRFWEEEFGLSVKRSHTTHNRMYSKDDIARFERIHYLLKVRRFAIEGVKMELKKPDDRVAPNPQMP